MKLDGLRVIDLSVFLPGPYLTLALADHGAEVIKIEPPDGDPGRRIGLADGPSTVFFRSLNRGKKSVVLNLKQPRDRDRLLALAATADVFVESFRPGVVDRLGVGYEQIARRNPGIVYCSVNAFGNHGPYRDHPAHDLAVEALTGVLSMTLGDDGRPALPGIPMADITAALQGLSGVLMALLKRQETGRGDYVEIAMFDSLLAATPNILGPVFAEGRHPNPKAAAHDRRRRVLPDLRHAGRQATRARRSGAEVHRARAECARSPRSRAAVHCAARGRTRRRWSSCCAAFFGGRPRQESLDWLAELDVCFAPVNTLLEATLDPNVAARDLLLRDEIGRAHLAPAIRFAGEPARPDLREPALGRAHGRRAGRARDRGGGVVTSAKERDA